MRQSSMFGAPRPAIYSPKGSERYESCSQMSTTGFLVSAIGNHLRFARVAITINSYVSHGQCRVELDE